MRKTLIIIALFLLTISAALQGIEGTGNMRCIYIERCSPVNRKPNIDLLIKAIVEVESNNNPLAYNVRENAVGAFQIRQCRVDHYNQLRGTHYVLEDFYSYELSKEMFLFFAKQFEDFETIARRWNGSGPATLVYWDLVKSKLNTLD